MTNVKVTLSEQDVADFLEGKEDYMEAYRVELERQLAFHFGSASVDLDFDTLVDKFEFDNNVDRAAVDHIMSLVANDMASWLPQ